MKKKTLLFLLTMTGALAFTACGDTGDTAAVTETEDGTEEQGTAAEGSLTYPLTLKVGYSTGEDDPRGVALASFKKEVEEATGGDILVEIHPSGELGSDSDLIAGEINGTVDMTVSSAGNYAVYATRMGVSALPFLFGDFEQAWAFIDSDTQKSVETDLEQYNIHVLSYFDNGFRCVTTTAAAGPVEKAADMNGLNIRTPDNQILMATMSALGAEPKSYPFTELKDAIKNGEFDAQENPIPVIYNSALYEVQDYLAITNHSYDAMPLTIRQDIWTGLTPEYQEVINTAAKNASDENRSIVKQQTEDLVSSLEEAGMTVTYPDLNEFRAATSGVVNVFADIYGEELTQKVKELYTE